MYKWPSPPSRHSSLSRASSWEEFFSRAALVKVAILDFDGVFTDNSVLEGGPSDFLKQKRWSYQDGIGVSILRSIGIPVCIVTGTSDAHAHTAESVVRRWNGLKTAREGNWNPVTLFTNVSGVSKVRVAEQWITGLGLSWADSIAMGDDLPDASLLQRARVTVAPLSAELCIKDIVDVVTRREGGSGAVRDLANLILEARGLNPLSLPSL